MELVLLEPKTELSIAGEKISAGLVAFEERKAKLTELKDEAEGLTVNGVNDREGLLKVSTVRKKIKAARVETEKEAFAMRSRLTKISKDISAKENELLLIIEPSEKALKLEEDRIAEEKEAIRVEAEKVEQARIQKRIDSLAAYGFKVELIIIQSLDDAPFAELVATAKVQYEQEQEVKAEEKRLADIEAKRVIAERKELEELRLKQVDQQKIIDEQNKKIREEQEEKEAAIRKENKRIENEKQKVIDDQKRADDLEAARIEGEKRALKLNEENEEKARLEAEEKLAMASDKVKFESVLAVLSNIMIPAMKSTKAKKIASEVINYLDSASQLISTNFKIKQL